MKKVSVVMCTYNGELFLKEQLDSILNQTYPIYEIIIQDDCSTDNTPLIIEEYSKKNPLIISYRNEKQQGVNNNFYLATSMAKGDYIAISDQDDIWDARKIERQIACIGDNLLCFCFSKPFTEGETSIAFDERIPNYFAERILFISVAPGHTILLHSDLVKKISSLTVFDCFMYDAVLQIVAALDQKIAFCPEVLVYQRRHINAATYTVPLDYNKTFTNMIKSVWRTLKLYVEIRPKMKHIFRERYHFLKATPIDAYKKQDAESLAFYIQEGGFLNYLKLTFLCIRLRDRLFYIKEKNYILSILRGAYFPISCTDYFRYLSSKIDIKKNIQAT